MSLKDSIKADAMGVFLKTSEFAETVTYIPRNGGRRVIRAIVDRSPAAVYDAAGNVVLPQYTIRVCNCCKTGIASAEIDTGGDSIELPERLHELQNTTRSIIRVTDHDEGMIELALT